MIIYTLHAVFIRIILCEFGARPFDEFRIYQESIADLQHFNFLTSTVRCYRKYVLLII